MIPVKIRFDHIGKTFRLRDRDFTALGDISFEVGSGVCCVTVGPSGCGKPTLLLIAAGIENPSAGRVTFERSASVGAENGMVLQGDSIFPWMTVWDNAAYGLRMRGTAEPQVREIVGHYLDRTGLGSFAQAYPHQLSGGMKQRVSIARAFACEPEVLFMDEPFSALDVQTRNLMEGELLGLWQGSGKTIVFVTHDLEEAIALADVVVVMTAGPARIKASYFVDIPRPRDIHEVRFHPRFTELYAAMWGDLRDEVLTSYERSRKA